MNTILLHVEDALSIRQLLKEVLGDKGITNVTSVTSVDEARRFLHGLETEGSKGRAVVICDGTLEKPSDGWDLALELHNDGWRVIVLSGDHPPTRGHKKLTS